jgi:uncharacterized membrane protein YhaH (DUF805 family)
MTQYFNFSGTATRSEYWAMVVLSFVGMVVMFMMMGLSPAFPLLLLFAFVLGVATLWYNLATTVRRIRDTGNNTWWVLSVFIPYLAIIPVIAFGVIETKKETKDV